MGETVKVFVLDVQQNEAGGAPEIAVWGRDEHGKVLKLVDRSFRPYFFVEPKEDLSGEEMELLAKKISSMNVEGRLPESVEVVKKTLLGKPKHLIRITMTNPVDVSRLRENVKNLHGVKEEYEYTIPFYKRFMIDRDLAPLGWFSAALKEEKAGEGAGFIVDGFEKIPDELYPPLRILAFDIEAVREGGEERIIMISFRDTKGLRKVISWKGIDVPFAEHVAGEKELIERFVEIVNEADPEIIVTYNGDRFDFSKLQERANKHGVSLAIGRGGSEMSFKRRGIIFSAWVDGRNHIDLYDFTENILSYTLSSDVLTLDRVSREILGEGKKDIEWEDLQAMWEEGENLADIAKYCLKDSELTLALAKKLLPQIFELCKVTRQTLFDASRMTYSQLVEWLLIKKAYDAGEVIPNRPKYEEIQLRRKAPPYTGGYVYQPKGGLHHGIALFDFKGLYPSITITHNVSPETLNCQCCPENQKEDVHRVPGEDYYYCKSHRGFVTRVVEELVKKRHEIKERMKHVSPGSHEHVILDSRQQAFKVLSNSIYGYYGYPGSRWYSRVCAKSITAWGREYIHSVIKMAEQAGFEVIYGDTDSLFIKVRSKKEAGKFLDAVNKSLPGAMEMEFHGIYKSGLFVPAKTGATAKKRYALVDEKGGLIIRGFEKVRRDWSQIARDTQEKVLKAVLIDNSPEKAIAVVRKTIKDLESGNMNMKKLIIYSQVTKKLEEYVQIGPHVSAARKSAARGRKIGEGSVIRYVITRGSGSISDRAEPFGYAENYDPDYYINNQVLPAVMRVLSGLGYTEEKVLGSDDEQSSLQEFIKKPLKHKIKNTILKLGKADD